MVGTRGPQNILEGYARDVARGGGGQFRTMRENIAAMDALVSAGLVGDGNTVDGSTLTGSRAYDTVIAQYPHDPLTAWEVPAPRLNLGDAVFDDVTVNGDLGIDGPTGSLRRLYWQTSGSNRWAWGTNNVVESAPVTTTASAAIAAGEPVIPVANAAGVSSGMQVIVSGVTSTTTVVTAAGTAQVNTTASVTVGTGSEVVPVANTAGILARMIISGAGIPSSSAVQLVGGTTATITTTTTTNVQVSFEFVAVASIAGISAGMLATGTGIDADTYVTSVVTGASIVAVALSKNRTATIPNGTTLTFRPAVVLSKVTTGTVTSGQVITASPCIVLSQNTTDAGVASGATITLLTNTGTPMNLMSWNDQGAQFQDPVVSFGRPTGLATFGTGLWVVPPVPQTPNGPSTFRPLFFEQASFRGYARSSGEFMHYNQINITGDSTDLGSSGAHGFLLSHTYGGQGFTGGRIALAINMQQTVGFASAGGAGTGLNNQRIGSNITVTAGESAGGTSATLGQSAGSLFAIATYTRLLGTGFGYVTGATNYKELCGYNLNLSTQTGTSVSTKHAINISPLADDVVQGTVQDVAIHFGMQPGAIGWKNLLAIGNVEGSYPLDVTANIWGTYRSAAPRAMQANYGLNWRDIAFTTAPIAVPGFVVDGGGNVSSGALVVSTSGNTTSIDAKLLHVTNTVVASSPGTTWQAGMGLYDASGNQWLCTATDGAGGTGAGHITGVSAVPVGPAYVASAPANPVAVTDQSGNATATLTLTWSTTPGLSIAPTGRLGFYGSAPVAKPTGVAVTAAGVHAALVTLGLIAA